MNYPSRFHDHWIPIALGGIIEVAVDMEGRTKKEIWAQEDAVILRLRAEGVDVVNKTNRELHLEKGYATKTAPGVMREIQKLGVEARRNLSKERHSEIMKKAWVARKARYPEKYGSPL